MMPLNRQATLLLLALIAFTLSADAQTRGTPDGDTTTADAPENTPSLDAEDDADAREATSEDDSADEDTATSSPERRRRVAPTTRLSEDLNARRPLIRDFVRTTTHTTTIARRQRTHTLQDHVREELRIEIHYGTNEADPAQLEVRIRRFTTSDPTAPPRLPGAARTEGLVLACWQEGFGTLCRDKNANGQEIPWPAWAVLDFDAWLTNSPVQTGSQWWRTLPGAHVTGWDESHYGDTQLHMEVQRPTPNAPSDRIAIEGTLTTNAELTLFGEKQRFEASGNVDATFSSLTKLIDTFNIRWTSLLERDALVNGDPTDWQRETRVHLRIETTPFSVENTLP